MATDIIARAMASKAQQTAEGKIPPIDSSVALYSFSASTMDELLNSGDFKTMISEIYTQEKQVLLVLKVTEDYYYIQPDRKVNITSLYSFNEEGKLQSEDIISRMEDKVTHLVNILFNQNATLTVAYNPLSPTSADLDGYATKEYVDDEISLIPITTTNYSIAIAENEGEYSLDDTAKATLDTLATKITSNENFVAFLNVANNGTYLVNNYHTDYFEGHSLSVDGNGNVEIVVYTITKNTDGEWVCLSSTVTK